MVFRQTPQTLQQAALDRPEPVLILPDHVGRQRYGAPLDERVLVSDESPRPFLYLLQEGGQTVVVTNAPGSRQRIPLDEMEAMAQEVADQTYRSPARAQERQEWHDALTRWRFEFYEWEQARKNGRQVFGSGTFAGSRRR